MQIHGVSHIHGPEGLKGPHNPQFQAGRATQAPSQPADQVDISAAAEAAAKLVDGEIRTELVSRVRAEIAAGKYETPGKLDAALENLLNEIG
jgi:negative regulator of flagellin synthesis FlgM